MPTGDTETIIAWEYKGLFKKSIKPHTAPGNNISPKLKWIHNSKIAVELKGTCFKLDNTTFTHKMS